MRKQSHLFILALGLLAVGAFAQEIVIEPTNGRVQATHSVTRKAAPDEKPTRGQGVVGSATLAGTQPAAQHSAARSAAPRRNAGNPTKKDSATQVADKPLTPQLEAKSPEPNPQAAAETAAPEAVAPAPKRVPASPAWAMSDARDEYTLKSEIANALVRDPKLNRSSIQIQVTDTEVTLTGVANGIEERLQAERMAQSYAWNRKLVDHIEVAPSVSAQK
jgi:osmotically-inducible protein OsmY